MYVNITETEHFDTNFVTEILLKLMQIQYSESFRFNIKKELTQTQNKL